tara:strand:- start:480 stop:626 length:147 start_codon:yes stop_codon:yes gene_type:complete
MEKVRLVENVNIRIQLDDMRILRKNADKLRMPISTYCRTKIVENLNEI